MMEYRASQFGEIIRLADFAGIPNDPNNRDRQAFEAWRAAGNEPEPYAEPADPVPPTISDRQFFQQLAVAGVVTNDEALAAVKTGDMPPTLQAFIDAMPEDEQFAVQMLLSGATVFERAHPLSGAIGAANGWTNVEVDDFFRAAAQL